MRWTQSSQADPRACRLADRHYPRQTTGSRQMMPAGRSLVLVTEDGLAVWGTSFQRSHDGVAMAFHAWPAAWNCSIFRNEGPALSSELIREAVAATLAVWGDAPADGMVTFVDRDKVRPKRDPGRCFLRAGFTNAGETASGKVVLILAPRDMPPPESPIGGEIGLFDAPRGVELHSRRTYPGGPIVPFDVSPFHARATRPADDEKS